MTTWARRVLSVISALLVAVGVFAAIDVQRGPSADTVLRRARDYVAAHPSVRFTGTLSVKVKEGDSELGASSSFTSRVKGEIEKKGRTHVVIAAGDEGVSEVVTADGVVYSRDAESVAKLADAKYARFNTNTDGGGVMQLDANQAQDLDLGSALAAARDPKKLKHSGKLTTIEADVNVVRLVGEALAKEIEEITLRLVVHKSGEVRSAVQLTGGQGAVITTSVRYSGWGSVVAIAVPTDSEVDPTPDLDEEDVLAWKDAPLLMPKAIPAGWALTYADVLSEDETAEGCEQIELDYENPDDPDASYMYLYEFPNSCAEPFAGAGVVEFSAGPYRGFGRYSDEDGSLVQITVGATTVQADSDLTLGELAQVLDEFVPLNFSVKPGQIAGIGARKTSV